MTRRIAPSAIRDKLETRIRRLSSSYSKEDQLRATNEGIALWSEYRDQLMLDLSWEPEQ